MPSSEIVCSEVAIIEAYAITKLTSIKIIGSGYATVGRPVVEDVLYRSIFPGVETIRVPREEGCGPRAAVRSLCM